MELLNINNQVPDTVYDFAVAPGDFGNRIVFAASQTGLFRSNDGGQTWRNTFDSLNLPEPLAASAVAISPNFQIDNHVFVAALGGVLRSENGGETWTVSTFPTPPPFITALEVSPQYPDDGVVFAGTMDDGIFRSSNRGANWKAWNFGLFDFHILSLTISPDFSNDKIVFVGTESGIFRSNNGGLGWKEVDFPLEYAPVLSLALSPRYSQDNNILVGTETAGLFSSSDAGKTWQSIARTKLVGSVNVFITSLKSPWKSEILVMNGEGIVVTRDQGQTWKNWEVGFESTEGIISIAAPFGIDKGSKLILGLADGRLLLV
jgi:photosystem II stability/assembly factor-like uncharacterized protein